MGVCSWDQSFPEAKFLTLEFVWQGWFHSAVVPVWCAVRGCVQNGDESSPPDAGSGIAPGRARAGQARGRRNVSPRGAAAAKSLQSCPTVRPDRLQLRRPWDSPNTGVACHFLLQCMGEAETVALRFRFGGSFPSGTSVASCLETFFSKESLPVCPLFQNRWGKEGQARTVTDLPAFLSPLTRPATPIGKVPQMPHSVSRGLLALTYPRVFSKPDPPQSEKTQPEGTGLQGLCARPRQESRPGVPQARPAEGASPQRICLPGTEFPWNPALSPSFTRTASRDTHCRELGWTTRPSCLPPLTLFLGSLLPASRH